ncbi:hypothetical protein [Alicyclobacillus shizuokensis]|uniref:hypothetical protein n=1 Tax=Alicyclobacillus shizuokensis TaxID=392014 RepID=UPI000832B975|nr:hypothetical protein [Alicyclobacillus shizuokensis]MCL6625871.1 hypothetical protein [Alicyclobacillus shizuokensis]
MDLSFLEDSIGKTIQLERGGPERIVGKLAAIMADYIAVDTPEEGVVYVNARHIKTISEPVIPQMQADRPAVDPDGQVIEEESPPLIEASDFDDLLAQLKHRLVRINHGGPNSVQGVLIELRPGVVTLLHDMQAYVHYPTYHIRSVTWIVQKPERADSRASGERPGRREGRG